MRFLLDVCASSRALHEALTDLGHDVRVARGALDLESDGTLLALAHEEGRILVTKDKDFGRLVFVQRFPHQGIVRLVRLTATEEIGVMRDLIEQHGDALREGAIVVVDRRRVRIRVTESEGWDEL